MKIKKMKYARLNGCYELFTRENDPGALYEYYNKETIIRKLKSSEILLTQEDLSEVDDFEYAKDKETIHCMYVLKPYELNSITRIFRSLYTELTGFDYDVDEPEGFCIWDPNTKVEIHFDRIKNISKKNMIRKRNELYGYPYIRDIANHRGFYVRFVVHKKDFYVEDKEIIISKTIEYVKDLVQRKKCSTFDIPLNYPINEMPMY